MMAQVEGAHGEQGWIRTQDIRLPAPPVMAGGPGCGHPGMASFPSARPTCPGRGGTNRAGLVGKGGQTGWTGQG